MNKLYQRVLLKLSGEGLSGKRGFGVDSQVILSLAEQIKQIKSSGVEVCIVTGGGNIFRGAKDRTVGIDRSQADQIGMMATIINAVFLKGALNSLGVETEIISGLSVQAVCHDYSYDYATDCLRKGKVLIFAGGTGNPYFTTDTGAVLRAVEMHCDAVLKASQVDGVYSADPLKNSNAVRYEEISYDQVITDNLKVMDLTAISLAKENNLPLVVFSQHDDNALVNVVQGKGLFSTIRNK